MKDLRDPFIRFKDIEPEEIFKGIKTPFYAIDEKMLIRNGEIIKGIIDRTGAKILLALKCFSNYDLFPLLSNYISGTEASGLFEARLGKEEMPNKEVHVFSGAYRDDEFEEILKYADHIIFNSINQLKKFGPIAKANGKEIGVRINPEFSTQDHAIYDPCAPKSRLGITIDTFKKEMTPELFSLLSGIHFHTLCQQNSNDLWLTLQEVDKKFGSYLKELKWINFGGGHHIVRSDYDINKLEECIYFAKKKYNNIDVYLEPGEGIVLNAGYLVSKVLDTFKNHDDYIAISDSSAACHMPDVIEMPYLPPLYKANLVSKGIEYRIGGPTCLSGDITGDYIFENELNIGDYLIFGDMALYTTCKNNTFNGMPLPDIYILHSDDTLEKLTNFSYKDFKYRLGK